VSHLGTRLFADRFKDADVGLAAVVPLLASVLHGRDALPPPTVTVYDDTRDLRICSTIADLPERGVSYPCIRFLTVGVDYADTNPTQDASGTWMTSGTLQLGAQLLLRDDDNRNAATDGMYLLRAMRNVALFFNVAPRRRTLGLRDHALADDEYPARQDRHGARRRARLSGFVVDHRSVLRIRSLLFLGPHSDADPLWL
jgi:hypothetical protein